MSQDDISKIAESIKKGFKSAYNEISKSITIFADKANKGAKEVALKLEVPKLDKQKREIFEQIGEIIFKEREVELKNAKHSNKLKSLIDMARAIDNEINGINAELDSLSEMAPAESAETPKKASVKKASAKKTVVKKADSKKNVEKVEKGEKPKKVTAKKTSVKEESAMGAAPEKAKVAKQKKAATKKVAVKKTAAKKVAGKTVEPSEDKTETAPIVENKTEE